MKLDACGSVDNVCLIVYWYNNVSTLENSSHIAKEGIHSYVGAKNGKFALIATNTWISKTHHLSLRK